MPPLHPHCRSTIVASLKGDSTPKGGRAARDKAGQYIRVPADMKYEWWYNKYISRKTEIEFRSVIGIVTAQNLEITGISAHFIDRAIEREVAYDEVIDALVHPLYIRPIKGKENGRSQEYIGEDARVVVNPDTGNMITAWKTSRKLREKYKKGGN